MHFIETVSYNRREYYHYHISNYSITMSYDVDFFVLRTRGRSNPNVFSSTARPQTAPPSVLFLDVQLSRRIAVENPGFSEGRGTPTVRRARFPVGRERTCGGFRFATTRRGWTTRQNDDVSRPCLVSRTGRDGDGHECDTRRDGKRASVL